MEFSDDLIKRAKEVFKDEHGVEMSDTDAQESLNNLAGLYEIFMKIANRQIQLKKRLKKEPKGFPVDAQHTCVVCYRMIDSATGWYDHNKQKCLSCQKAVDDGILPAFVCHYRDSFFLCWQLKDKFNIHSATARKLVREGKLVARIVRNEEYKHNEYIFLKKENPSLIERHSPARKSYDRHREKVAKDADRRRKEEMQSEKLKIRARHKDS
jgi:hypothetical protein